MQAAVLRVKLKHLDAWNARRKAVAQQYLDGLAGSSLVLPHVPDWSDPVWHLFVVRHPRRDELSTRLHDAGVGTLIHYPIPPHEQVAYAEAGFVSDAFPFAKRLAKEVLSLPIGPHLDILEAAKVMTAIANLE